MVGIPALRLKGIYLALVTIVFVEAVRSILKYEELVNITGGSPGIKGTRTRRRRGPGSTGVPISNKWFLYLAAVLPAGRVTDLVGSDPQPHRPGHGRHP